MLGTQASLPASVRQRAQRIHLPSSLSITRNSVRAGALMAGARARAPSKSARADLHVIGFERVAGGALQFGNRFIQLGLRAQLVAARCGERGLSFEHEEDG